MTRLRIVERRLVLAVALMTVFASLPALIGHARTVVATTTLTAVDEPSALVEAQSAQQPVMAASDSTEYAQTFVNPDGSFTDYVSATQQRMQLSDGTWANIDTTLQTQSDGTLAPAASPVQSVLSGGGAAPVVTVGLSAPGMTLSATSSGNVSATDSLGGDAFDIDAPRMWDSAAGGSTARGPGVAGLQAPASASLSGGTLTVTPDQGMPTGTGTFFPVFVGLHVHPREPSATVHGPCGGWIHVARDNEGNAWGEWQPKNKLPTGTSPPIAYGHDSGCPAKGVSFSATGAAKSASAGRWPSITLELRATDSDETNYNIDARKIFNVNTSSTTGDPSLQIKLSGLPDDAYRWQAQGIDSTNVTGPLSPACDFHVDTSPPATPVVTPPVDNSGSFTVSAWVKLTPPASCTSTPARCGAAGRASRSAGPGRQPLASDPRFAKIRDLVLVPGDLGQRLVAGLTGRCDVLQ